MTNRPAGIVALALLMLAWHVEPCRAAIERVWLTHRSNTPDRIVVNWQTERPGDSVVRYGPTAAYGQTVRVGEHVTLHQVEVPLGAARDGVVHYSVSTGDDASPDATFKAYPADVLRVAVVADWQGRPKLDAILRDDVHLLLTAGDNVDSLHRLCGAGVRDCTKPFVELVDAYPALFRSTPFMPVLGNHDREIRPRGPKPPAEPVYDVEATAFRKFFPLPDLGWAWRFDVPSVGARFVALDLQHIQDMGTTWQSGHPFDPGSEQFKWYERVMTADDATAPRPPFVVTLHNERNGGMRNQHGGAWGRLFERGTAVVTGFGYFAERADVNGFPYYNTSLSGRGAKYPDAKSAFFRSEDGYVLMTFTRNPRRLVIEVKSLAGEVMDRATHEARDAGR